MGFVQLSFLLRAETFHLRERTQANTYTRVENVSRTLLLWLVLYEVAAFCKNEQHLPITRSWLLTTTKKKRKSLTLSLIHI